MKIKNIIQSGELLSTEELADVLGGNGARGNNTNMFKSCSCSGTGDNSNGAEACICTNSSQCTNGDLKPANPLCADNKSLCATNGSKCTSNHSNCLTNGSSCTLNGMKC